MAITIQRIDDWLRDVEVTVTATGMEFVYLPDHNMSTKILVAPSIYKIKTQNFIKLEFSNVHTPWLHSGLHCDTNTIPATVTYRHELQDVGIGTTMHIPNPKKHKMQEEYIASISNQKSTYTMEQVPLTMVGTEMEDGGIYTQFSLVEDSKIKVTQNSSVDFTFEITEDLTEDTFIQIPIGTPYLSPYTIHGCVGNDSNLPNGAVVGIVGVKLEAKVDASLGGSLITNIADASNIFRSSTTLYSNSHTVSVTGTGSVGTPQWYTELTSQNKQVVETEPYLTYKRLDGQPYYVCGIQVVKSTFGSGIFVNNTNVVNVLPWGHVTKGISHKKVIQNIPENGVYRDEIPCSEIFEATQWKSALLPVLQYELQPVNTNTWLPVCANHLQITAKINFTHSIKYGITTLHHVYRPIQSADTLIACSLQAPATNQVLPLYTTTNTDSVFYTAKATYECGMRMHIYDVSSINNKINVLLFITSKDTTIGSGHSLDIERRILGGQGITSVGTAASISPYEVDTRGFMIDASYTTTATPVHDITGNWLYTTTTHRWRGSAYFVNSAKYPTVGRDTNTAMYTCIPVISQHTMLLVGHFPAGTTAGMYKYKPFKKFVIVKEPLNYLELNYTFYPITGIPTMDTTKTPFIGANIITTQTNKLLWEHSEKVDDTVLPAYKIACPIIAISVSQSAVPTTNHMFINVIIKPKEVPLIGYPLAERPVLVDIDEPGIEICDMPDLMQTAPFEWIWYKNQHATDAMVVAVIVPLYEKIYIVKVDIDDNGMATHYKEVVKTIEFRDTPFGDIVKMLGICQTKDIHYSTKLETNILCLYCMVIPENTNSSASLAVVLLRDDFEWDTNKDTLTRIPIMTANGNPYPISVEERWPCGIAVMYPYVYTLGYVFAHNKAEAPVYSILNTSRISVEGWQMCLICTDVFAGVSTIHSIVSDISMYRFTHGIPAKDTDFRTLYALDKNTVGDYGIYKWGTNRRWERSVSASIPREGTNEYPTIGGLCGISGQLLAVHNGLGKPVLINLIGNCVEVSGFTVYPYAFPFNNNITAANEKIYGMYMVQGRLMTACHPFLHLCLGDGLSPSDYATGIDIQDVSVDTEVVRMAKIRNNLLRDVLSSIELSVPEPTELPNSEMLYLGLTPTGPWNKTIIVAASLDPCETENFYIRVAPTDEILEPVTLYLNAKFNRTTELFGYRML